MEFTRVVLKPQATLQVIDMMEVDVEDWQSVDFTTTERDKPYTKWLKSFEGDCSIVYVQDPLREVRYYHLRTRALLTYRKAVLKS